jgi:hypothetical protein
MRTKKWAFSGPLLLMACALACESPTSMSRERGYAPGSNRSTLRTATMPGTGRAVSVVAQSRVGWQSARAGSTVIRSTDLKDGTATSKTTYDRVGLPASALVVIGSDTVDISYQWRTRGDSAFLIFEQLHTRGRDSVTILTPDGGRTVSFAQAALPNAMGSLPVLLRRGLSAIVRTLRPNTAAAATMIPRDTTEEQDHEDWEQWEQDEQDFIEYCQGQGLIEDEECTSCLSKLLDAIGKAADDAVVVYDMSQDECPPLDPSVCAHWITVHNETHAAAAAAWTAYFHCRSPSIAFAPPSLPREFLALRQRQLAT